MFTDILYINRILKKVFKKDIYEINQVAFNFCRSVYMYNEFARIYFNQKKSINAHNSW